MQKYAFANSKYNILMGANISKSQGKEIRHVTVRCCLTTVTAVKLRGSSSRLEQEGTIR